MRRLPLWAWLMVFTGLALVGLGGSLGSGSYVQALVLQFGSTALLLVPLLLIERSITGRLERKLEEETAIQQTQRLFDLDEMWRDMGQKLGGVKRSTVSPIQLGQMLCADGWQSQGVSHGFDLWRRDDRIFAVPREPVAVPAPIVRGALRRANWTDSRFEELAEATRGPNEERPD